MRKLPDKLRSAAEHAQHLADNALLSFVVINAALQRSSALCKYVAEPDVQKRMGSSFRVGMGFGLHAGCGSGAFCPQRDANPHPLLCCVSFMCKEGGHGGDGAILRLAIALMSCLFARLRLRCACCSAAQLEGGA